ncbi:SUMF1/EgtB/PvdO family nonheme iron enzyme [Lyngbya aestuarii]|uniref:SUMF1/EgtB/PvdO family nonheme iron enzyme n=1 Tax=Lyngbya aestuarii TaxID=118322 RepID=UPI00403E2F66
MADLKRGRLIPGMVASFESTNIDPASVSVATCLLLMADLTTVEIDFTKVKDAFKVPKPVILTLVMKWLSNRSRQLANLHYKVSENPQGIENKNIEIQDPFCLTIDLSIYENLPNPEIGIEMVAIPEGTFMMGSPKDEEHRSYRENPQHLVKIQPFFMGKYPISQAQWRAVAALPQVSCPLMPDPSAFKGADRPVEQVSWYEAVEFCARLSRKTGWEYRLPSEAEWEYACRAGTTTAFNFGKTITPELANHHSIESYGFSSNGKQCGATTPVGSFKIANAFGLYDMHGNVWEWCSDPWHSNYQGAPSDGTIWESAGDQRRRLLRGGSWRVYPKYCRSAFRVSDYANTRNSQYGFRLVLSPPLDYPNLSKNLSN